MRSQKIKKKKGEWKHSDRHGHRLLVLVILLHSEQFYLLILLQSIDVNVVNDHQQRNRAHHAPHPDRLAHAAQRQTQHRQFSPQVSENRSDIPDLDQIHDSQDDEDDEPSHHRAMRNSRSKNGPGPQTLKYYPTTWQKVLTQAKSKFHLYLAVTCAFPGGRDEDMRVPSDLIAQCIAHAVAKGVELDKSKNLVFLIYYYSTD